MLSTRTRYALHALVYLALKRKNGAVRVSEIAEVNRLPRKFLENILVELKKGGLLESKRGQQGGYRLVQDPETIRLGDIVRILEGPLLISPCSDGGNCAECSLRGYCNLRSSLRTINQKSVMTLNEIRLSGLIRSKSTCKNVVKKTGSTFPR